MVDINEDRYNQLIMNVEIFNINNISALSVIGEWIWNYQEQSMNNDALFPSGIHILVPDHFAPSQTAPNIKFDWT